MDRRSLQETIHSMTLPAAILEVLPDSLFRLIDINAPARTLFQTDVDPRGRFVSEFVFSPTAGERTQALAERCVAEQDSCTSEETFVLRDDSVVHTRITLAPLINGDGIDVILLTVANITELVELRMKHARELAMVAGGLVEMCAWCNGVVTEHGLMPPDEFVRELSVEHTASVRCPDCQTGGQL